MIFDPKEELLPPVSLPKSVEHQLPYYAPSQGEANIIPQHSPQQGAPEQDNQLRQLELVSVVYCCFVDSSPTLDM